MPPFEHEMCGDEHVILKDADFRGERMHLDHAAPRGIRHNVEIAADADHTVARDPALEVQHRPERGCNRPARAAWPS